MWGLWGRSVQRGMGKRRTFACLIKWNTDNNKNLAVPISGCWIFIFSVIAACLIWKWSLFLQPLNIWAFCIESRTNDLSCNYFQKAEMCVWHWEWHGIVLETHLNTVSKNGWGLVTVTCGTSWNSSQISLFYSQRSEANSMEFVGC